VASGKWRVKRSGLDVLPLASRGSPFDNPCRIALLRWIALWRGGAVAERGRESFSVDTVTTWEDVWPRKTPGPFPLPVQGFAQENHTLAVNVAGRRRVTAIAILEDSG
jgi:hypothetical protein